tara:strand:+ start:589 stop:780 length:192 start_codon:yes stop_codon:yes gene_type:complete
MKGLSWVKFKGLGIGWCFAASSSGEDAVEGCEAEGGGVGFFIYFKPLYTANAFARALGVLKEG